MLATGLLDREWVAAQVGRALDDDDALRALDDPQVSPHPLVQPDWVAPARPWLRPDGGGTGLAWYLADPEHRLRSPHPLVSLSVIDLLLPEARSHPAGPVAAWLAHVRHSPDAVLPSRPGTPVTTLGEVRRASFDAVRRHRAVASAPGPSARRAPVDGRVSVVVAGHDATRTVNWLRAVADVAAVAAATLDAGEDVEVVVVGVRPDLAHRVLVDSVAHAYVVPVLLVSPDLDRAVETGTAGATGSRLVVVRPGAVPDGPTAVRLARALDDPGTGTAQPLLVGRDDVVVGAGAVSAADPAAPAEPFLAGHAAADAEALGRVEVPAPLGPVVAVRAGGGPGPGRVVLQPEVRFVVPRGAAALDLPVDPLPVGSESLTDSLLRRVGFEPEAYYSVRAGRPHRRAEIAEAAPRLRWTIDTAARPGAGGETWGDTHFARSLAAALGRLGQHVAVDPAAARERWSRELDDVVLVVRGLDRVAPRPGPLTLLWVISHPDLVTADEVASYDLVFAASLRWAADRTREWGLPVEPLLQCTDPALFNPGRAAPDTGADVLFVGSSRGVRRPALAGALAAGADVTVHGIGWEEVLPDLQVASSGVGNAEVGRLYAAAHVVLNDHWEDMRRDGFLSNRLFDAAACGSRVISDDIAGVEEVFGAQVRTFADGTSLAALLADVPGAFPDRDTRLSLAARVADEHSFDHRAATLLDAAATRLRP